MNLFKLLAATAAVGIILTAFREEEGEGWLLPGLGATGGEGDEDREPVLGFDGMDVDTLLEWLEDSDVGRSELLRMLRYEAENRGRQPVLAALVDRL